MKNIIVGTAGHIDHGKTTLIKALTGRNTDRWEEEQRRGITIDLGFTYFDLKNSISNFEDINSQNIILGNGAAEAIFNIVRALKPKKALLPAPTFQNMKKLF